VKQEIKEAENKFEQESKILTERLEELVKEYKLLGSE
jgi:hypothetical protein